MAVVMLKVDLDSPREVADQLRLQIEDKVARGECRPGNRLPTVRQLALEMELNANTVSRMFHDLEQDGYLMYRAGAGFYCIDLREKVAGRRTGVFDLDQQPENKPEKPKKQAKKQAGKQAKKK